MDLTGMFSTVFSSEVSGGEDLMLMLFCTVALCSTERELTLCSNYSWKLDVYFNQPLQNFEHVTATECDRAGLMLHVSVFNI